MEGAHKLVSSDAEELILVDEDDTEIGFLAKAKCHDGTGILHRAFSLFLFNEAGELLLQRRSESKRLWPGYWSNTCCSHPRKGESMTIATRRASATGTQLRAKKRIRHRSRWHCRRTSLQ